MHLCDKFANFGLILKIYHATVARLSHDSRATFVRVSHDFSVAPGNLFSFKFVQQSRDIRASVARHSYECRLVLFPRQIVARFSQDCLATVVRLSRDICTSVAKISHCKFTKISRRQGDTRTTVARQSCKIVWRKNSHKIFKHV